MEHSSADKQTESASPLVGIIMGSKSDWDTMSAAAETLTQFGVPHECRVMSAHRSPALAAEFAANAESRGLQVVIAGAGGAAHLAGVMAAHTLLPVLGVPMKSDALKGLDSLLATVQMPAGIPVGTLAIGKAGATNAALLAIAIIANGNAELREKLRRYREQMEQKIRATELP
jgi:5-(carboxyamino)imidazole ribonucleotide mutase